MKKTQMIKLGFACAFTFSILGACGPAPTEAVKPSPTPSAASPSITPSVEPSVEPSVIASSSPGEMPTVMPTTSPDSSSVPSSSPSASASSPDAVPTSDIATVENTTFNGKVFDDSNAPLDGVTVKVKSLSSGAIYEESTTTAGGAYAFNNAPAGVQLEIIASKAGYATRRRVEVLKSNKTGDPDANRYDFGTDGGSSDFGVEYNSLSDKPEVIAVTPGRNASGISPDTSFVLKFSEPMDTDTVEQNFGVYAATDEELSVGIDLYGGSQDYPDSGSLIWDESAFNISWNSDDTEVTFTFKDEQQLLTDTESENVPDYFVSLLVDDGQIKDKSGITREVETDFRPAVLVVSEDREGFFKLTDGDFEVAYKFSIDTDEDEPQVDSINVLTEENGNTEGDEIEVEFSEPMVYYIENEFSVRQISNSNEVRGNSQEDAPDEDPINADNYFISVNGSAEIAWSNVYPGFHIATSAGGYATFDTTDRTHKTVLLRLDNPSDDIFEPGDKVNIRVSSSVVDPAGNSVDSANDEEDDTAS